jgi:tetratricopeptide (TPR) repeat protein
VTTEGPSADKITERMRREDARLRRRTLLLTLVPIAVGIAVVAAAYFGVSDANQRVDEADERVEALRLEETALYEELARLDRELANREALFREVERRLPESDRAQTALIEEGQLLTQKGDFGGASVAYGQAIEVNPDSALAHKGMGYAQFRAREYERAAASLETAISLDPGLAEAYYYLGLSLWQLGQRNEAVETTERAFELDARLRARAQREALYKPIWDHRDKLNARGSADTEDEERWVQEGLALAKQGRYDEATRAYRRALAANPENALVLNWSGYANFRSGRHRRAVEDLRRAIELEPGYAEAHYNLALALWAAGDADAALKELEQAFDLEPALQKMAMQDPHSQEIRHHMLRQSR